MRGKLSYFPSEARIVVGVFTRGVSGMCKTKGGPIERRPDAGHEEELQTTKRKILLDMLPVGTYRYLSTCRQYSFLYLNKYMVHTSFIQIQILPKIVPSILYWHLAVSTTGTAVGILCSNMHTGSPWWSFIINKVIRSYYQVGKIIGMKNNTIGNRYSVQFVHVPH